MANVAFGSLEVDLKELDKLDRRIKDLNQKEIQWGYFEESKYNTDDIRNGKPIAGYAYLHEIGYAPNNLPSRPFFTQSIEMAQAVVLNVAPVIYALTFIGTPKRGDKIVYNNQWKLKMFVVGKELAETVRKSIETQNFVQLSPNTKSRKTDNKDSILLETEQLYDGVDFKVVNTSKTPKT